MISDQNKVLIVTHDIKVNQTFTNRYLSFNHALNNKDYESMIIGLKFPFKPHPYNNLNENKLNNQINNVIHIVVKKLNIIQKLILYVDNKELSFSKKKILLALHLIFFKVDQWLIHQKDFVNVDSKASIILSGGASGIIKSASKLADIKRAKLIIDYRDPINFGYHLLETNKLIYKFKRFFTIQNEIKFLKKSSHIITVSESLKSFFPPEFQEKITVIENGSNYEFNDIYNKINHKPQKFNIVYLGTVYNDQLIDETFFKTVQEFIEYHKINNDNFKIYFLGSNLNTKLSEVISRYNLVPFINVTERLDQDEILPYLLNASMFLHLKYGNRTQIITSKNADYLLFKKPILLPVSDNGDLAESITKHRAGYICNDQDESLTVLNNEYSKFLKKEKITLDNGDFSYMSRSEISKKLITVIENLKNQ